MSLQSDINEMYLNLGRMREMILSGEAREKGLETKLAASDNRYVAEVRRSAVLNETLIMAQARFRDVIGEGATKPNLCEVARIFTMLSEAIERQKA